MKIKFHIKEIYYNGIMDKRDKEKPEPIDEEKNKIIEEIKN